MSLAEQHEAKEEVIDPGPLRSQAAAWAAEPQWVEPPKGEELSGEEWFMRQFGSRRVSGAAGQLGPCALIPAA